MGPEMIKVVFVVNAWEVNSHSIPSIAKNIKMTASPVLPVDETNFGNVKPYAFGFAGLSQGLGWWFASFCFSVDSDILFLSTYRVNSAHASTLFLNKVYPEVSVRTVLKGFFCIPVQVEKIYVDIS